tara:strand:- start:13338 stop:16730 length:3393 start_codon:yes stop_codon:yes gene_type:complete
MISHAQTSLDYNADTIKVSGENLNQYLGETVINIGTSLDGGNTLIGISAPAENNSAGAFYIFSDINLTSDLDSGDALKQVTGSVTERFGKTVASYGDIDKDNKNDIVFANPNSESVSILLGSAIETYSTQSDLITLTADTLALENANARYFGNQIAIAGDVNGDGYDDILIGGSKKTTDTTNTNGRAYLIFGQDSFNSLENGNIATDSDIIFEGTSSTEFTGYSVDILPDINRDGYDEIIISSFDQNSQVGHNVYLIYGSSSYSDRLSGSTFDLSQADAIFSYSDTSTAINFGETVKGVGDLNGDGYNEFIISGPSDDNEKIFIFFGSSEMLSGNLAAETTADVIINGTNTYFLGLHAIQGEFDLNGDGYGDLAISEFLDPVSASDSGSVFIFYGSSNFASLGTNLTESNADLVIENASTIGKIGISLSNLMDRNGNGIDELMVGSVGYNSISNGQAGIFELNTKTATSPAGGSIEFFSDSSYSTTLTSTPRQSTVYVQLSNADPNENEQNIILMEADSTTSHKTLPFKLYETTVNSGIYRGEFIPVQTRTSLQTKQLNTSVSDTVTVQVKADNTISNTFNTTNAAPIIDILSLEQIGTMNNTTVDITFKVTDYEENTIDLDENESQLQYSTDSGQNWSNATITGTLAGLSSSDQGISYTSESDKLVWSIATDISNVNGTVNFRIQGYDQTILGDYNSTEINIDNEAPEAPILTQPTLNFAYSFTLTGTTEPNATLYVYRNNIRIATTNVSSDGTFSLSNVSVTDSNDLISAIAIDAFGFSSPTSNEVSLTLSDYTDSISDGNFELTVNVPLGVTTNSETIAMTHLDSIEYTAPTLYNYIDLFELTYGDNTYSNFNQNITVNITLTNTLTTPNGVAVYYYDETANEWSTDGITVYDVSITSLNFITDHFSTFAVVQLIDPFLPTINNIAIDGSTIASNKYYSSNPTITTTMSDTDSYIASWKIEIYDDITNVLQTSYEETSLTSNSVDISFSPSQTTTTLSDSRYLITLTATDQYGNVQTKSSYFQVNESSLIFSALHAPNPYNPDSGNLTFSYNISQDVDDIYIIIFDQGQRQIWSYETSSVPAGYYLLEWDGNSSNGMTLPNGMYFAYCVAKNGTSTKKEILKIAIMR